MGDDVDDIDVKELEESGEAPPEALEESAEVRKSKRKIYKGRVVTAQQLQKELEELGAGPVPIQPMTRRIEGRKGYELPPTFILTRFQPTHVKNRMFVHYYTPGSHAVSYREVPADFEFNLLLGERGKELEGEWAKAQENHLHEIVRRQGCTVGADPEIFAEYSKGKLKGQVMPAWDWLAGKPGEKWTSTGGSYTGTMYWDGFQAEWNTPGGIHCLMQMSDSIQGGLKALHNRAKAVGGKLTVKSVYEVHPDFLMAASDEHVAFGCSPSKNLYGLKGNIQDGRAVPYRFAGGHIHMGLSERDEERHLKPMVRAMDAILGVACVSLFASFDNPVRRQFYGQPGEYRTPAHGLEYRVLSNAWLSHPLIFHLVFDLARAAAGIGTSGMLSLWKAKEEETIETILAHDVDRARGILRRNEKVFRGVLKVIGGSYLTYVDQAHSAWLGGIESVVKDPGDIVDNWHLEDSWNQNDNYFGRFAPKLASGKKV